MSKQIKNCPILHVNWCQLTTNCKYFRIDKEQQTFCQFHERRHYKKLAEAGSRVRIGIVDKTSE